MPPAPERRFWLPREDALGLSRIANGAGLTISVLPNGCIFAIEHRDAIGAVMINQILGSPLAGGIGRLVLRTDDGQVSAIANPGTSVRFGTGQDCIVWEGESAALAHRVVLFLHPALNIWRWRVEIANRSRSPVSADAIFAQDLGLGPRGFVMNNEAYASQYIDHHVESHPRFGPVVMSRQNLAQAGRHPWIAQGCLDGAASFATDAFQIFGPAFRDQSVPTPSFGMSLAGTVFQHEVACPAIQSRPVTLGPGDAAAWTFFALFEPDHPLASGPADLARIDKAAAGLGDETPAEVGLATPVASLVADALPLAAAALGESSIAGRYPERLHEECRGGELLSFFVPDPPHNRHVVLAAKERIVARRHGTLLRSGDGMLPDETTLCSTAWMHGVFAAQLTIGNTSFHKLFTVARDPYNIVRTSGLRIVADCGRSWRLLSVPSAFEMGLSGCRWIYQLDDRTITVAAVAAGDDPAMQWQVTVEGPPCRFLVFGHLALGERELDSAGEVTVDSERKRLALRPDPASLFGQRYRQAVYHLVTSTPDAVEAIGGDELLYADGVARGGPYIALRTGPTRELRFAVVGSLADPAAAERLADKYSQPVEAADMLASARRYWAHVTRGLTISGPDPDAESLNTILPWLAHNAMIHLTVPHGLEQYTGAAWGTRDVCQGPVEFLLALEHDEPVREILRIVFAQQYETRGDWPQWFMLEPYSSIQDMHSHGDVIVWPLKALCDYVEATGDLAFLDEPVAWRRADTLDRTPSRDPVTAHVEKLLATVAARFIPGTNLIRYGEGDWNDSLRPVDPRMQDWMVSAWTVALLYQQLVRYAEILRRAGRAGEAERSEHSAALMRADFHRHLMRDGVVAGYALFEPGGGPPELLLHPDDRRTGLRYSLLPMFQAILAGLFSPEEARRHYGLIREHLVFPDGARLMDRPVAYRGGIETIFQRAESAAFFGREIGLMYVHAHLRTCEAMAELGAAEDFRQGLLAVSPISVTEHVPHASLRQRNAYFSSSDAAFPDRYAAASDWEALRRGAIAVDGGWRIYSSGPGLYMNAVVRHALGVRRYFGERSVAPLMAGLSAEWTRDGRQETLSSDQ